MCQRQLVCNYAKLERGDSMFFGLIIRTAVRMYTMLLPALMLFVVFGKFTVVVYN